MHLVLVAARRLAPQPGPVDRLERSLKAYRDVLRAWNDNLNRNLALVHTYFGISAREHLGGFLFEEFRAIGEELDQFVREVTPPDRGAVRVRSIARRINGLSHAVCEFDLFVVRAIQAGHLGVEAPKALGPERPPRAVGRFGDMGSDVRALQAALATRGGGDLTIDGHFGLATERALVSAQVKLNLSER